MSLVRYNPFLGRWPDIWDDDDLSLNTTANNLDVYETEDEVVVKANVAGVDEKDIEVTFEDGVLLVTGEKKEEKEDKEKTHYSKSMWSYSYKVAVPGVIDTSKDISAETENGVLTVVFKKAEVAKPKKLTVKAKKK